MLPPVLKAQDNVGVSDQSQKHVAGLMRINHTGEVCAQALYAGQALSAHSDKITQAMLEAAREEADHLAWCGQRLVELGSQPSRLNALFYTGSYIMGVVAGTLGDPFSLGFVEETERQVCLHLDSHLESIPDNDFSSRIILEQMRVDEAQHGDSANALGAQELPLLVRGGMKVMSRVMTFSVYRL